MSSNKIPTERLKYSHSLGKTGFADSHRVQLLLWSTWQLGCYRWGLWRRFCQLSLGLGFVAAAASLRATVVLLLEVLKGLRDLLLYFFYSFLM